MGGNMNTFNLTKSERKGKSYQEIQFLRKIKSNEYKLQQRLQRLKQIKEYQDESESWKQSEFACGKYNGLMFAISVLEESVFVSKPMPPKPEKPSFLQQLKEKIKRAGDTN